MPRTFSSSMARWARPWIKETEKETNFFIFNNSNNKTETNITPIQNDRLELLIGQKERVAHYCYLGIHLDESLSCEMHAQQIINKVSAKITQLEKLNDTAYCRIWRYLLALVNSRKQEKTTNITKQGTEMCIGKRWKIQHNRAPQRSQTK